MTRTPIFDRPMTTAERKRRSRAYGGKLREHSAPRLAAQLGGSPQFFRDLAYVQQHGVPEWHELRLKGIMLFGASTQRQMVKHLSPQAQRDLIEIAKQDKEEALAIWKALEGG